MRIERSQVLAAEPYQRTEKRRGSANGFRPKTVTTRLGELALEVPQVRGKVEFYLSALECGVRSERAAKCRTCSWDARYEKLRQGGSVVPCAVPNSFGVEKSGYRTALIVGNEPLVDAGYKVAR